MRARHPAVPAAFALLFALSCAQSPDAPPAGVGPAMKVVWGGGLADTALATPKWPLNQLVVQVWGLTGKPQRSIGVDFDAGRPACPGYPYVYDDCSRILFQSPVDGTFASRVTAITDAEGRATVRIHMGALAGPASVKITPQDYYGLADSAAFTVLPGSAYAVRALLPDTTVDLGGTFAARGALVDRPGNLRSDPVTFETASPVLQVSGTGAVSAQAIGRAYVRVRATVGGTTATDSTAVTVVPRARLIVHWGSKLSLESLAGGDVRRVLDASLPTGLGDLSSPPVWSPGGERIAFGSNYGFLAIADTLGYEAALATPGVFSASWPEYSRDGLWIYFQGNTAGGLTQAFRVHPDGTGLEALLAPGEKGWFVSPSPDGTRFAYSDFSGKLLVKTMATGHIDTLTTTGVPGVRLTRWSPDGNWIAFVDNSSAAIGLIRPDGSGIRNLGGFGWDGVSWSPDSKWLVTSRGNLLELVDVTAGTFYLTTTPGFAAAWHP